MTVSQHRISDLITAAKTYQERYSSVVSVIELLHKMVCTGSITATDAIERLHVQFGEKGLPLDATIVIEREFTRYNLTRKRNDYMREYQRRRRAGALRAPYDNTAANALTLAEIEKAIANTSAGARSAPSSNAGAETAPSAAFDAELSADDLL